MIFKRYGAGLLAVLITLVTAFVAIPASILTPEVVIGLAIVGLQAVGTFFLPLVGGPWKSALKTGVNVLLAILAAVVPLLTTGQLNATQVGIVVLAGLNALASEIGVSIRLDPVVAPVSLDGSFDISTLPAGDSTGVLLTGGEMYEADSYEGRHERE